MDDLLREDTELSTRDTEWVSTLIGKSRIALLELLNWNSGNCVGKVWVQDLGTIGSIDMTAQLGDALVESKDLLGLSKVVDCHNLSGHLRFENLVLILST